MTSSHSEAELLGRVRITVGVLDQVRGDGYPGELRASRELREAEVVHVVGVERGFVVVEVGDF